MATVQTIALAALKEIGVIAQGETMPDADFDDCLAAFNRLVDQWAAERLAIYTTTRTVWTITASDQDYTVGVGGDVNVARPVFVDHINFQDTSQSPTLELPMSPLTEDEYASIRLKQQTSTYPRWWYYNPTHPLAALRLWPMPTSTTLQGVLYAPQAIAQFSAIGDAVTVPPGYERAMVKALALEIAPSYGAQVTPLLVAQAEDAKAVVRAANKRVMDMSLDPALVGNSRRGGWSIYWGP